MTAKQPDDPYKQTNEQHLEGSSEFLRQLFTWLFLLGLAIFHQTLGFLGWFSRFLRHRWIKRAIGISLVLAVGLTAFRAVPVIYARFALAHAAGDAARQLHLKGEARVLADLRRAAAGLGLLEAAADGGVFRLQTADADGGTWCTISFDFTHEVDCYGFGRWPVAIRGKVLRLVQEPVPGAPPPDPD
jgi:hypothetical protein